MKHVHTMFFLGLTVLQTVWAVAEERVDYERQVKPILREKCYACHGGLKQEAELRLDTVTLARKGGSSGPALVAGDPAASLIIQRVIASDPIERMPQDGAPVTPEQLALLKAWIAQGATPPAVEEPERDPREHWAFRVPVRPPLPSVRNPIWAQNPIDVFVAAEHEKRRLTPQPPADKALLLRRVYLDLIGLPPSRAELQAFVADTSPDAYERAVDRLLESPLYGERWARHWMDVWRYSDWYGRRMVPDVWNSAPQIWRWRDWIVNSLNQDKGYDQMVREMLAADEIAPEDESTAVATGYLIRNWFALNHNEWMRDNVEHTAKAFLALTFNCCHCHDHKYDPILQEDYFRLRAFFEPIGIRQDRVAGEPDPGLFQEYQYGVLRKVLTIGAVRIYDKQIDAPTWFYTGGDERNRVTQKGSIPPGVPASLPGPPLTIAAIDLPPRAYYPGLQPGIRETILNERRQAIQLAEKELAMATHEVAAKLPPLEEQLAAAQAALNGALAAASDSAPVALAGQQSLRLDATQGRRILNQALTELKALPNGSTIRFLLQLERDAHFNFQLAKDVNQGLTAGFVAFEQGQIKAYQPGSFAEFEAGRYNFAAGQSRFEVELTIDMTGDRCLLRVTSLSDKAVLVNQVPVALNGWNPVGNPVQAITFDARTGSVVWLDNVAVTEAPAAVAAAGSAASAGRNLANFDFEAPTYLEERDVVGTAGWSASSFSVAPGKSVVSTMATTPEVQARREAFAAAQRALELGELPVKAATARLSAARAELHGVEARMAADTAQFSGMAATALAPLVEAASKAQREADVATAAALVLTREQSVATAEAKPASDAMRATEIATSTKQLAEARTALDQARAALNDAAKATTYASFTPKYPQRSSGRRRALAEWIASPQNALTARVAVNHIWMRHFHAPLVPTVFDFGRNGAPPTHPELLDWLAVEFVESGWSMKHVHRLLVTSQTYRQSSAAGSAADAMARDPENRFLWRMNTGRMEAEAIRDSVLACADNLDLQMAGRELENSQALVTRRRSVYYSCHPEADGMSEFGALFDAPDANECYRRTRSIVPQQALALTNSDFVHKQSVLLATQLWSEVASGGGGSPDALQVAFISAAYQQILSRPPTEQETTLCRSFLQQQGELARRTDPTSADSRAREGLIRVLFNHNDFVTIR